MSELASGNGVVELGFMGSLVPLVNHSKIRKLNLLDFRQEKTTPSS